MTRTLFMMFLVAAFLTQGCGGEVTGPDEQAQAGALATVASVNGARIGPLSQIVDASNNTWTVVSGVVYKNGAKAGFSSDVEYLLYLNGEIYQNVSTSWWSWTGTAWAATPDPLVTSSNDSEVASSSYLVDGNHSVWAIRGGVVYVNGAPAGQTADVTNLVYANGRIFQKNSFQNWYEWNGASWPLSAPPIPPPAAKSAAYSTLAFDTPFLDLSGIDLENTQAQGFDWYVTCWFCTPSSSSAFSIVKDGAVTALHIDGSGAGNSIYSVLKGKNGVVGSEFGGGAYFEARLAMEEPENGAHSWPAFWALPNLDDSNNAWPGGTIPGYDDHVELDILELMPLAETSYLSPLPTIGSTLHDWYGVYDVTCAPDHYCQVPSSVHLSDSATVKLESTATALVYNTIGVLWVPSKKNATTGVYSQGHVQFYLNDVAYGNPITWTGPLPSTITVPTTKTPWTFAAMDLFKYGLILGTGGNAFMNVQWVHAWQ